MRTKDFLTWREQVVAYSSPIVDVLNLRAEGVLCGSYDRPGAGYDDENDLGEI